MNMNSTSEQEFLTRLSEIIEANLENENFGVTELASAMGMSRITLFRKAKPIIKKSISEYIKETRLKKAYELLKKNNGTVAEISYRVGFRNPSYFNKCFHDYYGYPPGQVGKREESESIPIDKSSKKRRAVIVSSVFFMVLIVLVLFVVVKPFSFQHKKLVKSIAIRPFIDYSPEEGNTHIINGLMDEILIKLEGIDELDVKSRTDSEKYRESNKSIKQMGRELNVNYILEGSGQVINNEIKLTLQLIDVNSGNHVWADNFIKDIEDIFELQEDVAISVASALKATLTTKEINQIEKKPTENEVAYNHYLRGLEYLRLFHSTQSLYNQKEQKINFQKARAEFEKAIALDPNFARPYLFKSFSYINILAITSNIELQSAYLDSGLYFAEKVLSFDHVDELDYRWAVLLKGTYYQKKGMRDEAMKYFKQVDKRSKQFEQWETYQGLAIRYAIFEEYSESIKNALQYINLKPLEEEIPIYMLMNFRDIYKSTGHFEQAKNYAHEEFVSNSDSISYLINLAVIEWYSGNNQKTFDYLEQAYKIDSTNTGCLKWYTGFFGFQKDYTKAGYYLNKYVSARKNSNQEITPNSFFGYIYLMNGEKSKADSTFRAAIEFNLKEIKYGTTNANKYYSHVSLASSYAVLNEKEKALNYLNEFKNRKTVAIDWLIWLKESPIFDNIRNEPEFKEILADAEAKYQKEHDRVGELLRELGEIE